MNLSINPEEMPCQWSVIWWELCNLEGSRTAENQGEVWNYMGSKIANDQIIHTFRHRCHPDTNGYKYRHIPINLNVIGQRIIK